MLFSEIAVLFFGEGVLSACNAENSYSCYFVLLLFSMRISNSFRIALRSYVNALQELKAFIKIRSPEAVSIILVTDLIIKLASLCFFWSTNDLKDSFSMFFFEATNFMRILNRYYSRFDSILMSPSRLCLSK